MPTQFVFKRSRNDESHPNAGSAATEHCQTVYDRKIANSGKSKAHSETIQLPGFLLSIGNESNDKQLKAHKETFEGEFCKDFFANRGVDVKERGSIRKYETERENIDNEE
ncbi:hypothetical protein [Legionella drozanskii]|uniref:hypothetical protein n=1 Tax=Legionella drozanskii TaxID=96228 RepID=UPI0010419AC0|nr:hypothetical protein [Legionella drozanskii]